MEPALRPGDWLLARRTARVRPGQIVLAWHPQRPGFLLVKRVAWGEADGWWLASDNPAAGAVDSARFGPVPPENIVAVVFLRYWPLFIAPDGKRRHRIGRGKQPVSRGGDPPYPRGLRARSQKPRSYRAR
jgi:nickel-type superoxide dismutase maturation protease